MQELILSITDQLQVLEDLIAGRDCVVRKFHALVSSDILSETTTFMGCKSLERAEEAVSQKLQRYTAIAEQMAREEDIQTDLLDKLRVGQRSRASFAPFMAIGLLTVFLPRSRPPRLPFYRRPATIPLAKNDAKRWSYSSLLARIIGAI